MLDHMSSTGVMHGDGRRRGEERVKHEVKKEHIAAVHTRYRNNTSQYALGAILSQKDKQGKLCPVGYYSKTLIPAECNYDVYDRELLALVCTLQHWRHLLLGAEHPIEVFTDHDNLTKY